MKVKAKIGSVMASYTVLFKIILVLLSLSDSAVHVLSLSFGINYGQIANNLPSPSRVSVLLQTLNVSRVKLYDADPNVLQAFSNSQVDFHHRTRQQKFAEHEGSSQGPSLDPAARPASPSPDKNHLHHRGKRNPRRKRHSAHVVSPPCNAICL